MVYAVSEQEMLQVRTESFAKIEPGTLFYLGLERHYIAVDKSEDSVRAIELSPKNRLKIVAGDRVEPITLHLDELGGIHIPDDRIWTDTVWSNMVIPRVQEK